jgi:excisionase family DNA binding protein
MLFSLASASRVSDLMTKIPTYPVSVLDDPALASSRVITVREARAILRIGLTKLYDLLGDGSIKSYKDGASRRIYLYSVLQYQAAQAALGSQLPEKAA